MELCWQWQTWVSSSSCLTSSSRALNSRRSIFTSASSSDRRCLHWSDEHSTDDLHVTITHSHTHGTQEHSTDDLHVTITHSHTHSHTHGSQEHSTDHLHVTITHSLAHSWHTGTLHRRPACDNYTLTDTHSWHTGTLHRRPACDNCTLTHSLTRSWHIGRLTRSRHTGTLYHSYHSHKDSRSVLLLTMPW